MTYQDAQELLNSMYPPQRVDHSHTDANKKLLIIERKALLRLIIDFEKQKTRLVYNSVLAGVAKRAMRFVTVASPNKSGRNSPVSPKSMPLLIQQVLFYLAVRGKEYDLCKQEEIITALNLNIGKIYTKMPFEPGYYLSVRDYRQLYKSLEGGNYNPRANVKAKAAYIPKYPFSQPQVLFKYNGKKAGVLGVAIKNLVYQAGKFDRFVDVFGGTGSATLAFPKRGYTEYVYNELNKTLFELYKVIKYPDYKLLIQEIQSLKSALRGEKPWLDGEVNFEKEMTDFFNRPYKTDKIKQRSKRKSGEKELYDFRYADTSISFIDVYNYIDAIVETLKAHIQNANNKFSFVYEGEKYTAQELFDNIVVLTSGYEFLIDYYEDYDFYSALGAKLFLPSVKAIRVDDAQNITAQDSYVSTIKDAKLREMQVRFYKYYSYFANLLKQSGVACTSVRRPLAYIYLMSFVTSNSVDLSAITRMTATRGKTISNAWKAFLYPTERSKGDKLPEQEEAIRVLHKAFEKVELLNKNFSNVIRSALNKETLYYVDSPYIGTIGYSGMDFDVNAVAMPAFGINRMKQLIRRLAIVSNKGDKFIFSCRACLSDQNAKNDNNIRVDYTIVKRVFNRFFNEFYCSCYFKKTMHLWVVTIQEDSSKDFFKDLVANHDTAEIMIVNYKIQNFVVDKLYPKSKYKVYTFEDFIVKVLQHLK